MPQDFIHESIQEEEEGEDEESASDRTDEEEALLLSDFHLLVEANLCPLQTKTRRNTRARPPLFPHAFAERCRLCIPNVLARCNQHVRPAMYTMFPTAHDLY